MAAANELDDEEVILRAARLPDALKPVPIYVGPDKPIDCSWLAISRVPSGPPACPETFILYFIDDRGEPTEFLERDTLEEAIQEAQSIAGFDRNGWAVCSLAVASDTIDLRSLQREIAIHSAQSELQDPDLRVAFRLFVNLETAQHTAPPGESVLERLATPPWKSTDPAIEAAWEELTQPRNLPALEAWSRQGSMNPTARRTADEALRRCRARSTRGDR